MTKLQTRAVGLNAMLKGKLYLTDLNEAYAQFEKEHSTYKIIVTVSELETTIEKETKTNKKELERFNMIAFSNMNSVQLLELKTEIMKVIK